MPFPVKYTHFKEPVSEIKLSLTILLLIKNTSKVVIDLTKESHFFLSSIQAVKKSKKAATAAGATNIWAYSKAITFHKREL